MSEAPAPPPPTLPAADSGDWSRAIAERQLAILSRLAEVAMEVVEALKDQARGGPVVVQGDVALAVDRVARAVRHTLMLQAKVVETIEDHEAGRARLKADLAANAARLVREAIDEDPQARGDVQRREHLRGEAAQRLRAEDVGDLLTRPFGEAVAGVCRDLDLAPDWLALAEDCYAVEVELGRKRDGASKAPEPEDDWPIEVRRLNSRSPPHPAPALASDSS